MLAAHNANTNTGFIEFVLPTLTTADASIVAAYVCARLDSLRLEYPLAYAALLPLCAYLRYAALMPGSSLVLPYMSAELYVQAW